MPKPILFSLVLKVLKTSYKEIPYGTFRSILLQAGLKISIYTSLIHSHQAVFFILAKISDIIKISRLKKLKISRLETEFKAILTFE